MHFGTKARKALGHLKGTWALWRIKHLSAWLINAPGRLDTLALETLETLGGT